MKRCCAVLVIVGLALVGVIGASADSAIVRHSGRISAIDLRAGRMTLEELGSWTVSGGARMQQITIDLKADTHATLALRAPEPVDDDFPGAFVEAPLELGSLEPGDYVTVECEHVRGRLIALRVTVALEE